MNECRSILEPANRSRTARVRSERYRPRFPPETRQWGTLNQKSCIGAITANLDGCSDTQLMTLTADTMAVEGVNEIKNPAQAPVDEGVNMAMVLPKNRAGYRATSSRLPQSFQQRQRARVHLA
jgi:hypothetical protein